MNAIPPTLFFIGWIGYYETFKNANENLNISFSKMIRISLLITMFIPVISGIYLFMALHLIKKSVRNNAKINIEAMTLHAASYGLYMASVLIYICVYMI